MTAKTPLRYGTLICLTAIVSALMGCGTGPLATIEDSALNGASATGGNRVAADLNDDSGTAAGADLCGATPIPLPGPDDTCEATPMPLPDPELLSDGTCDATPIPLPGPDDTCEATPMPLPDPELLSDGTCDATPMPLP